MRLIIDQQETNIHIASYTITVRQLMEAIKNFTKNSKEYSIQYQDENKKCVDLELNKTLKEYGINENGSFILTSKAESQKGNNNEHQSQQRTTTIQNQVQQQVASMDPEQDKISELLKDVKRKDFKIKQLEEEIHEYQTKQECQNKKISDLNDSNKKLQEQLHEKQLELSENQEVEKLFQSYKDQVQIWKNSLKDEIDYLKYNINEKDIKIYDLKQEIIESRQKVGFNNIQPWFDPRQQTIQGNADNEVQKLRKQVRENFAEIQRQKEIIQNFEQTNIQKDKEIKQLKEQIEKLKTEKGFQKQTQIPRIMDIENDYRSSQMQVLPSKQKLNNHTNLNNKFKQKMQSAQETHGFIQIGLLIDVTKSMETYKDATIQIIKAAINTVKKKTHRNCEWGTVCYQDIEELQLYKKRGQLYREHSFTKDSDKIVTYLSNIDCFGGGDAPEDLKGGIIQLCNNLEWNKHFKIAFLVTDSPCHGKRWINKEGVKDDHPNENLEDGLKLLIEKNIVLFCVELNPFTSNMYSEMVKFYKKEGREKLLHIVDLKDLVVKMDMKNNTHEQQEEQIKQLAEQFRVHLEKLAVQITCVNIPTTFTKVKKDTNNEEENLDGALEAVIKADYQGSNFDFLNKVENTVKTTFKVYNVQLKESAFNEKITDICSLQVPDDFQCTLLSQWSCLRTDQPFAKGQMKSVYLMKKEEDLKLPILYVLKSPINKETYSSMNEAITEFRSHLISQKLLIQFQNELKKSNSKIDNCVFQFKYVDILIFQENENKYWIGERFIPGQFYKYNNNNGYVIEDNTIHNNFLQAFSIYTYFKSECNYMVQDVQGIGYNLTDPAINTFKSNFDDTDMGQDGLNQYLIAIKETKNQQVDEILDNLRLNINDI